MSTDNPDLASRPGHLAWQNAALTMAAHTRKVSDSLLDLRLRIDPVARARGPLVQESRKLVTGLLMLLFIERNDLLNQAQRLEQLADFPESSVSQAKAISLMIYEHLDSMLPTIGRAVKELLVDHTGNTWTIADVVERDVTSIDSLMVKIFDIATEPTAWEEPPPPRFVVYVDDNFHFMDTESRWCLGWFSSYEVAVQQCKAIVDECLSEYFTRGRKAEDVFSDYRTFGDDPWITGSKTHFSAWDYARARCVEMCGNEVTEQEEPLF